MQYLNLTPHAITILLDDGREVNIPPSGDVARVKTTAIPAGTVGPECIPTVRQRLGKVTVVTKGGAVIPFEEYATQRPDTIFVVSLIVLRALQGEPYVVAPDTGPASAVRDEYGRIRAVRRFVVET